MNIKYAFLNLCRKPIVTMVTIFQLIASIMLLYCSVSVNYYITWKTNEMKKVYDNKNLYSISTEYMPEINEISTGSLEDFNKYLKTSSKFNYYFIDNDSQYINIGKNNGEFVKAYSTKNVNNEDYQLVYDLNVDESFVSKFSFKVSTGRVFEKEDFQVEKNKPIPIILGDCYRKLYKLGDTIKYLDYYQNPELFKVIGFLEKGYYLADGRAPDDLNLLDKYIICPQQKIYLQKNDSNDIKYAEELYKIDLLNNSFDGYININEKDKDKIKDIISEITAKAKNNGFDINVVSINETIEKFKASINAEERIMNFLLLTLSIFSSVGIISSLSYSVLKQTKEFGIHIMHGAVLKDLAKRVFYELVLMFFVAILCSFLIIITFLNKDIILKFNQRSFYITLILSLAFSFLLSIIPIYKTMKFTVDELVRGKE